MNDIKKIRKKRTTKIKQESLKDPVFLVKLLAEALQNARVDRTKAAGFLDSLISAPVSDGDEGNSIFRANAVAKLLDSLSRINSQVVEVAKMIIVNRDVNLDINADVPVKELGMDPEEFYEKFPEEEGGLSDLVPPEEEKGN